MGLSILLVDDEGDVRISLSRFIKKLGHHVVCAQRADQGLDEFHKRDFDLVITDIRMPGIDGLELLKQLKRVEKSPADVIVITGHGDMENAVSALKYGAFDYLQKPINVRELAHNLERVEEIKTLRRNYSSLKKEFKQRVEQKTRDLAGEAERLRQAYLIEVGLGNLRIFSEKMQKVLDLARRYSADRTLPVLIIGESGTGKELIARFVHHYQACDPLSPFVAVNCAAISAQLFEAEFFGHRPGAFTGASSQGRRGKLEAAEGGTIFLDEIGEMPAEQQVKLLRVLEDRAFYPVGGTELVPVDVRVISATNKNLPREVEAGGFRTDLFYRINTGALFIPPLRQRPEEIMPLALHFVQRASQRHGREFGSFSRSAQKMLTANPWPGNVRQLKNLMERLALMGPWDRVDKDDLQKLVDQQLPCPEPEDGSARLDAGSLPLPESGLDLEELNRSIIKRALERNQGNQTATAKFLGLSRRALQGRLKKMGI